jgi:hypothetical protein
MKMIRIEHLAAILLLMFFIFLVLGCAATPAPAPAPIAAPEMRVTEDGNFEYFIWEEPKTKEKICIITSYGGESKEVVIPDTIENISVIEIDENAFAGNQLVSVIISDSVTYIGPKAFANNQIASVTIPGRVRGIDAEAFAGNQLVSVVISDGVTYIGPKAFAGNQIAGVTIPRRVREIGPEAFAGNQLTDLTISDGVKDIGIKAFANNQLTSVIIPSSVRNIWQEAFGDNPLTSVTLFNGVIQINKGAFKNNRLTSVSIPGSVTNIGAEAFAGDRLTSITLPADVRVSASPQANIYGFEEYYLLCGRPGGTYTRNGEEWYYNGALLAKPAKLVNSRYFFVASVDGSPPPGGGVFCLAEGTYTIKVNYSSTNTTFLGKDIILAQESASSTLTVRLMGGKTYEASGTRQGAIVSFSIRPK